jgi:hypothetical protein
MDASLFAEAMSVISVSLVVGLSMLFPSNVLLEATLESVSRFDGFVSSSAIMSADVGGLNPYTLCHPILERLQMSLISARWVTQVRLAPSTGVLQFDGPALVSLPLLLLEQKVVLYQHGV